jgi:hypothetical protein
MPMFGHRRVVWKAALALLAGVLALSVVSIAAAQSSANFQLGCWGVVSGGGGIRTSPGSNRMLVDSTGQWAAAAELPTGGTTSEMASSSYTIRSGYIQQYGFITGAIRAASPSLIGQTWEVYIPFLNRDLRIIYVCPY